MLAGVGLGLAARDVIAADALGGWGSGGGGGLSWGRGSRPLASDLRVRGRARGAPGGCAPPPRPRRRSPPPPPRCRRAYRAAATRTRRARPSALATAGP